MTKKNTMEFFNYFFPASPLAIMNSLHNLEKTFKEKVRRQHQLPQKSKSGIL